MNARKAAKDHEQRAADLGHVPREVRVPKVQGTLGKLQNTLSDRTHSVLLRRIKSGR